MKSFLDLWSLRSKEASSSLWDKGANLLTKTQANERIRALIGGTEPCMIARLGATELSCLRRFERDENWGAIKIALRQIKSGFNYSWPDAYQNLKLYSGFYPITKQALRRFHGEMIKAMPCVDLLGSWLQGEGSYGRLFAKAEICQLAALEPYYHENPWSGALKGQSVLVIHPFAETIRNQYLHHRDQIFSDPNVLPAFQLLTLQAVQTVGHASSTHASWFAALDWMEEKAMALHFDTAIIGCGAYGFPLAARLKSAGKKVIHLGGATQLLFGIKGKRWDAHPDASGFYNSAWTRPTFHETPKGAELVEGGTYW